MTELLAAMRDASFRPSPGTARRYHVLTDEGLAACNTRPEFVHSAMPLDTAAARPAGSVAEVLRCRRPACRRLWPA